MTSPSDAAHLLLIDLSSIYWQAWHSVGPAEPSTAAHDATVRRVRKLAGRYEHTAICCDSPKSWRRERYAGYKANREAKPPEARAQYRAVIDTLRADGFVLWEIAGMEADDVIASATSRRDKIGASVTIATADKDLAQLVTDDVRILSTRDGSITGREEVRARYGVEPEQIGDWLALVGDTSDNVPGVPGIGPKGASALLTRYRHISGILDAAADQQSEIKPKARESLLSDVARLSMARALVELRSDQEVDVSEAVRPRRPMPLPSASDDEIGAATLEEEEQMGDETKDAAIVVTEPGNAAITAAAAPKPRGGGEYLEEVWRTAGVVTNSRMFGSVTSREAAAVLLMEADERRYPRIAFLRGVHMIEGKSTLSAQLMCGLIMASGRALYLGPTADRGAKSATWRTRRVGSPDEVTVTWTIEDAERAGLTRKATWQRHPAQMLSWRAASDLARMVYPDVVGGLYTPDELEEA